MIENIVSDLMETTNSLIKAVEEDMVDVRKAKHDSLLVRNEEKLVLMDKLANGKKELNEQLTIEYQKGNDISVYKESIDRLEDKLQELYTLNGRLASIVLPVKEMYREIIEDISKNNGGSLIEVMA